MFAMDVIVLSLGLSRLGQLTSTASPPEKGMIEINVDKEPQVRLPRWQRLQTRQ